jgi:hypothetical protein
MSKLLDFAYDFIKWLFGYLQRPVLAIEYERDNEPFVGSDVLNDNRIARFFRLSVTNQGKTPAAECQGYLVSVEAVPGARAAAKRLGKPEILKWAHEADFHPICLEAGERRKLDLFYIYDDEPSRLYFFFKEPDVPVGVKSHFDAGDYRVSVRINHKGHRPVHGHFLVKSVAGMVVITPAERTPVPTTASS